MSNIAHPYLSNNMPVGNNVLTTSSRGGEEGNYGAEFALIEDLARLSPKTFSLEWLKIVTDSFADDRILGSGGSGTVYEGHLGDAHGQVAVKIIKPDSPRAKKEFSSEVMTLSQLRHKNLVQLIGYCHEVNEFIVVYEFIGGGSLEDHLFGDRPLLTWESRYNIALELALALHYLHKLCHQCVIHRDIKSSNVMLDEKFVVKLGDFGLARLVDHTGVPNTTELLGTWGYVAPECFRESKATMKSDVYSFGVVLLEIVCGIKVIGSKLGKQGLGLVPWVWKRYGSWSWAGRGNLSWHWRDKFLKVVDRRLSGDFDKKQAEVLLTVGLWCANPIAESRPSIEEAMDVLNFKKEPPKLPTQMPSFSIN